MMKGRIRRKHARPIDFRKKEKEQGYVGTKNLPLLAPQACGASFRTSISIVP